MKQPGILLKSAVITSSILLAGVFVLYKAGVFNDAGTAAGALPETAGMIDLAEPIAVVGSSVPDTPEVHQPDAAARPTDSSDAAAKRAIERAARKDTARGGRHFFHGSKSGAHLIDLDDTDSSQAVDTTSTERRDTTPRRRERFMGGSKSLAPLIESPDPKPQQARPSDTSKSPKRKQ